MTYLIRFAAIVCVVLGSFVVGGAVLRADDTDEGTIIQIGPDHGSQQPGGVQRQGQQFGRSGRRVPNHGNAPVMVSRYWIGIEGAMPSPALRSQLELEPEEGLLINRIMPNSPAEEAELEQYDVITRVNGKQVASVPELSEHVGEQGENKGRLAIEIIRRAKPRTVWVTPEERPIEQFNHPQPRMPFEGDQFFGERLFGDKPFGGRPFEQGGASNFNRQLIQNGVQISISQQNDGPMQIRVKKGDQTWEIEGDDPESLEALPEDVRPMVERMLKQREPVRERGFGDFGQPLFQNAFPSQDLLQHKLEAMQRQLEAMQQQLGVDEILTDEALEEPIEQAEPSEIELPPDNDP